jgi:uncharacterized protein DUF6916
MMQRREFLMRGGSTLVLVGLGLPGALAPRALAAGAPAVEGGASWKALINERFTLHHEARGPVPLTLAAVRDHEVTSRLDQFSLTFLGDERVRIAEGMYRLEHPRAGGIMLHLQPAGDQPAGTQYRADFSLLT